MKSAIRILLIEDDLDDVEVLENSLHYNSVPFELKVLYDGAAAIDYIKTNNLPHPHIIIMDLNLPKIHGRDVIREIKSSTYAQIPLLILTTSSANEDKLYAQKNHATAFLVKPNTREGLNEMVQMIIRIAEQSKSGASGSTAAGSREP